MLCYRRGFDTPDARMGVDIGAVKVRRNALTNALAMRASQENAGRTSNAPYRGRNAGSRGRLLPPQTIQHLLTPIRKIII